MEVKQAEFVISNSDPTRCPKPDKPEYAFIGRSNVGKSSLINMLTTRHKLAKTSQTPGKTQLINHFLINTDWYLVDLPGYGFAKAPQREREKWEKMIDTYLSERPNLICTFILVDSRIEPQRIDLEFMERMGQRGLPFVIIFTKAEKVSSNAIQQMVKKYGQTLLKTWTELPPMFVSSAVSSRGKEEILAYIDQLNKDFYQEMKATK
ncbi:ribosome biogenesis GTP-binding protein YihA/YsxC [Larkinella knui]|uniref:Probable GTP-binding protein EngB n=1 Tax=Larkinella knui TaxID=2025310 RepID=A0A3P1CQR0_9BACT|nr:ribosome biogenesis GTP-binding protein YihA/YsxC [Larkinella knui]RRB15588.1 YihA family ribosome biogenesis GTP-binding protein [Larkinella knui]